MADDWKQQWKTAKKTFEDATNRNKPSQPFKARVGPTGPLGLQAIG